MTNQFKVGDRVLYVGFNLKYRGLIGIVTRTDISAMIGWYSVQLGPHRVITYYSCLKRLSSDRLVEEARDRQRHGKPF